MTTETITWTPVSEGLPDDEITVELSLDETHSEPTWPGYHCANQWFTADGMPIEGVIGWAHRPAGLRP